MPGAGTGDATSAARGATRSAAAAVEGVEGVAAQVFQAWGGREGVAGRGTEAVVGVGVDERLGEAGGAGAARGYRVWGGGRGGHVGAIVVVVVVVVGGGGDGGAEQSGKRGPADNQARGEASPLLGSKVRFPAMFPELTAQG